MAGLPKVGVQAVVEGVAKSIKDLSRFNDQIKTIGEAALGLGKAWQSAGANQSSFVKSLGALGIKITQIAGKTSAASTALQKFGVDAQHGAAGVARWGVALVKTHPILLAVGAGVLALIGHLSLIKKAFDNAKATIEKITTVLKKVTKVVIDLAVKGFKFLGKTIKSITKTVLTPFINAWEGLVRVLKNVAIVSAGILLRDAIRGIFDALGGIPARAVEAAASFQLMEIRLQGLIARQLVAGETTGQWITKTNELTASQKLSQMTIQKEYDITAGKTAELTDTVNRLSDAYGENHEKTLRAQVALEDNQRSLQQLSGQLSKFAGTVQVWDEQTTGVMGYGRALKLAAPKAEELFEWVAKLAVTTPYGAQEIANVLTLGHSYDFTTAEAKRLTMATIDFAAGMGLSNLAMTRIVENLGQMKQQGKITGTELRDLGRGAFLPITRILEITADMLGITTDELADLRKNGTADAKAFIEGFVKFAEGDFAGAAERMARSVETVKNNIGDLIDVMLGFRIVKPSLDLISGFAADLLNAILGGEQGRADESLPDFLKDPSDETGLTGWANRAGTAIEQMVQRWLSALPSAEEVIKSLKDWLDKLWVAGVQFEDGRISAALETLGVPDWILESATNLLTGFKNISDFWEESGGTIKTAIKDAFSGIFSQLTGDEDPFADLTQRWLEWTESLNSTAAVLEVQKIRDAIEEVITVLTGKPAPQTGSERQEATGSQIDRGQDVGAFGNIFEQMGINVSTEGLISDIAGHVGTIVGHITTLVGFVKEVGDKGIFGVLFGGNEGMMTNPSPDSSVFEDLIFGLFAGNPIAESGDTAGADRVLAGKAKFGEMFQGISDVITNGEGKTAIDNLNNWTIEQVPMSFEEMKQLIVGNSIVPEMWEMIISVFDEGGTTLVEKTEITTIKVQALFLTMFNQVKEMLDRLIVLFEKTGQATINGIVDGMEDAWDKRRKDLEKILMEMIAMAEEMYEIGSPSKRWARMGEQLMEGMAMGISNGRGLVAAAASSVMAALPASSAVPFTGASTTTNVTNFNVNMTNNVNEQSAAEVADNLLAAITVLRTA